MSAIGPMIATLSRWLNLTPSEALSRVVAENEAMRERLVATQALHRPVEVPGIPGTNLAPFTRCSCTRGLLFAECETAAALAGESRAVETDQEDQS